MEMVLGGIAARDGTYGARVVLEGIWLMIGGGWEGNKIGLLALLVAGVWGESEAEGRVIDEAV